MAALGKGAQKERNSPKARSPPMHAKGEKLAKGEISPNAAPTAPQTDANPTKQEHEPTNQWQAPTKQGKLLLI